MWRLLILTASLASWSNGNFFASSHDSPQTACDAIAHTFTARNVHMQYAQYVKKGSNITFDTRGPLSTCGDPTAPPGAPYSLPAPVSLCRVAYKVITSTTSNVSVEAWLPDPSTWTGRFLTTGNGGLNGCLSYTDMQYAVGLGFATVGTNNGHDGTSGISFYQKPEVVTDFAWRAVHVGAVTGKAVTKAYYGQCHSKSYYLGCSTGGRQGFKAAQDFPEDFDGIVAGAPAFAFANLTAWSGHYFDIVQSNKSASFLSPAEWGLVQQDVLKQCDGLDGAIDGIIEDPQLCEYKPARLRCRLGVPKTSQCLSTEQMVTVNRVLAPYYGDDGALIFPRQQPGTEVSSGSIFASGSLFIYTWDWQRYVVRNEPGWNPSTFTVQDAINAANQAKNADDIQTWKGDLSAFRNRGGKLLHYHGQADPIITSANSPRYYEHVASTMGPPEVLDEFYRFFTISGMSHCAMGPGAWQIGQAGDQTNAVDEQNNVLLRMVKWVEQGSAFAPDTVTGTKFVNDTPSAGVDFVRNHCRYPLRNKCIDPANYKDPKSWKCVD